MKYKSKLIIIRGNSGTGKTSIAKRLQEQSSQKTAIIELDYFRRMVLKEKESEGNDIVGLLRQTAIYALRKNYTVIIEGILKKAKYGKMLHQLIQQCPKYYVYYLDVSLDETLRRHQTKPNAHEFGEREMRRWYLQDDVLGVKGEVIIPESSSLATTVRRIRKETKVV